MEVCTIHAVRLYGVDSQLEVFGGTVQTRGLEISLFSKHNRGNKLE